MKCAYCNATETSVLESRTIDQGECIRRRRLCDRCEKRFTTYEKVKEWDLTVVKRDETRQLFDVFKLKSGIIKALEKRPVTPQQIDNVLKCIQVKIKDNHYKEVSSNVIGEYVMWQLKAVDEVAYVRYASVYRQFKDIQQFVEEVEKIQS